MSVADVMGCGRKGGALKREDDDFVPTPADATEAVLYHPLFRGLVPVGTKLWEPACGNGAISRVAIANGYPTISTNINDRGYGQRGVNFLTTRKKRADVLFTNPPFDAPTGSAADFLKHAAYLGIKVVVMLLKTTYQHAGRDRGWLQDGRWKPTIKLECGWRIDFTGDGASPMDMAWFIWVDPGQTGRMPHTILELLHRPTAQAFLPAMPPVDLSAVAQDVDLMMRGAVA